MSVNAVTQHATRPSPGVHVTATILTLDDTLTADDGFAGLAIKQVMPSAVTVLRSDVNKIQIGERYFLWDSGEADFAIPLGLSFTMVKGLALWIDPVDNALYTAAAAGRLKLGKIRYVFPERGLTGAVASVHAGFATIGFDARKDM